MVRREELSSLDLNNFISACFCSRHCFFLLNMLNANMLDSLLSVDMSPLPIKLLYDLLLDLLS